MGSAVEPVLAPVWAVPLVAGVVVVAVVLPAVEEVEAWLLKAMLEEDGPPQDEPVLAPARDPV